MIWVRYSPGTAPSLRRTSCMSHPGATREGSTLSDWLTILAEEDPQNKGRFRDGRGDSKHDMSKLLPQQENKLKYLLSVLVWHSIKKNNATSYLGLLMLICFQYQILPRIWVAGTLPLYPPQATLPLPGPYPPVSQAGHGDLRLRG